MLERDTRLERGETAWSHIACTLLRCHSTRLEGLVETAVMASLSGTLDPKGEKQSGLT